MEAYSTTPPEPGHKGRGFMVRGALPPRRPLSVCGMGARQELQRKEALLAVRRSPRPRATRCYRAYQVGVKEAPGVGKLA